jgi:hypothetical protein
MCEPGLRLADLDEADRAAVTAEARKLVKQEYGLAGESLTLPTHFARIVRAESVAPHRA